MRRKIMMEKRELIKTMLHEHKKFRKIRQFYNFTKLEKNIYIKIEGNCSVNGKIDNSHTLLDNIYSSLFLL